MKNYGFTLLELIITIAVAAILLTIAVPNMRDFILNNRMTGHANEFVTALNHARSEALKRNRRVQLCGSTDGETCASGNVDWSANRIVVDPHPDDGEVVRVFDGSPTVGQLLVLKLPGNNQAIEFQSNGALNTSATTLSTAESCSNAVCFLLCEPSQDAPNQCASSSRCRSGMDLAFRRVTVSSTGSVVIDSRPCS